MGRRWIDMMYFDQISIFEEEPEYNSVTAYCIQCGKSNSLDLELFDELVDKEYAILKEGVTVKCRGCGKEHEDRKIIYERKNKTIVNIPRCPICQSTNLKKISTGSKIFAAATMGGFAIPYTSKTFECKNCGYKI